MGKQNEEDIYSRMPKPIQRGVPKWVWIALAVLVAAGVVAFVFH